MYSKKNQRHNPAPFCSLEANLAPKGLLFSRSKEFPIMSDEEDDTRPIPYPWERRFSEDFQVHYYFNSLNGETSWDFPSSQSDRAGVGIPSTSNSGRNADGYDETQQWSSNPNQSFGDYEDYGDETVSDQFAQSEEPALQHSTAVQGGGGPGDPDTWDSGDTDGGPRDPYSSAHGNQQNMHMKIMMLMYAGNMLMMKLAVVI